MVSQLEFEGVKFPGANTTDGKLVDKYFELYEQRFERFSDPETQQLDQQALGEARDRVLAQLSPELSRALRSRPILGVLGDENINRVEQEFLEAGVLRDEYEGIVPILDRWNGKPMAKSQYATLQKFWDQTSLITDVMRLERERDLTPQELAKGAGISESSAQAILSEPVNVEITPSDVRGWLADQQGIEGDMRLFAINMASSSARSEPGIANPARDTFLQQNRALLEPWFPSIYGIGFERRQVELASR